MQLVLKSVNVQVLVAFETYEIVSVAFVVAEEQVLAMYGIMDVFPILQALFYGGECRMFVYFVFYVVGFQKVKDFLPERFPFRHRFSANCSKEDRSLILLRIVTTGSTISSPFISESFSFIIRPATGAHEPFSMIPTRRLQ